MTQPTLESVAQPEPHNAGITNGREIAAYAVAQLIKIVLTYAASFTGLLSPIYLAAMHVGGQIAVYGIGAVISGFWTAGALILFLLLRSGFSGVPAMIAGPGGRGAMTSRGGEIGAYAIAYAVVIGAVLALNVSLLGMVYRALGQRGQRGLIYLVGLCVSVAVAVVAYLIFIGLRSAFCRR